MDSELVLDGNSVAGLLGEVFSVEATTMIARCAACGGEGALATARVYSQCPGVVMRCPECAAVVMRFARVRGRLAADFRGVGMLTIQA
jgi:Family of unknown function (DUF6510)